MNLRTYRPELPPNTIYRPHTLLERLCRETPPPAPKRTFRHAPKEPADVAIGDSLEATRQNATEALTICLAPESGEQPLPPIQDGPAEAPARQHKPTSLILIAAMMAAAMMPPPGGRRP